MTRKIIEIKVTSRGSDGNQVTFINALDSLRGTILEQYDDILEAGIESAIYQQNLKARKMESDGIYEVSSTFHDPTLVLVGLDDDITATATVKASGIKRPFVKDLRSPLTKKVYHHESGIVGFMEGDDNFMLKIIRFPIRMLNELGMDNLTELYPEITDCLEFRPPRGRKSTAIIDGDLSYRETRPFIFYEDVARFEQQYIELMEYGLKFQKDVIATASLCKKAARRKREVIQDFTEAGDVIRFHDELKHSPWGMDMYIGPFPQPMLVNGIMGRMYTYGSNANPEKKYVYEVWIPVSMIKEIRSRLFRKWFRKPVPFKEVEDFLNQDRMSIGGYGPMETIADSPPVQIVGDIVYASKCTGMQEYDNLREEINTLGMEYLNKRMETLRVFG